MNISMDDIEQFQKHFVTPLVEAVKDEVRPLVARVEGLEKDVATLKKDQKRALVGYGVFSAGLAAVLSFATNKIKSYLHL